MISIFYMGVNRLRPHTVGTSWRVLLPALLLGISGGAAITFVASAGHLADYPIAKLSAGTTLVATLGPLLGRMVTGQFDILEPLVGANLMLAVLFGARPFVTLATNDFFLYPEHSASHQFDAAAVLGTVAAITFTAAYSYARRRPGLTHTRSPNSRTFNVSKVLLYGAGTSLLAFALFSLYLSQVGGIGTLLRGRSTGILVQSSEYLSAAPIVPACAAGLWVLAKRGRLTRTDKYAVAAAAILAASIFALLGNRRFIIPCLALPLILTYLASRRRPRKATLVLVLPMVFLALATIPFARAEGAREQAGGAPSIFAQAFQNPGIALSRFMEGPDTAMVLALAVQIQHQADTERFYWGQASVGDMLLAPIPSLVFPDKPVTARDDLLIDVFGTPCVGVAGGRCPDFSVVGTLYQDFAWLGVPVGMSILGLLAGYLWRRLETEPDNAYVCVSVAVGTIFLPIIIRAGLMPATAWALYFLVPIALGIWWTSRTRLRVGAPS